MFLEYDFCFANAICVYFCLVCVSVICHVDDVICFFLNGKIDDSSNGIFLNLNLSSS